MRHPHTVEKLTNVHKRENTQPIGAPDPRPDREGRRTTAPGSEESGPASDCDCPGCTHWRRVLPHSRAGGHPAARLAAPGPDGPPRPATRSGPVKGEGRDGTAPNGPGAGALPRPAATGTSHGAVGYPGRVMFRPGADNAHVTRLGRQLVRKGFGTFYEEGPGPRWGEGDRRSVEAFQRAQGWRGGAADGCPGPETWRRLFH